MANQTLDAYRSPRLLERLLDTPNLPQVVRSLDPEILHRLVRVVGLEDCGELVSLATPAQLMRVFDAICGEATDPADVDGSMPIGLGCGSRSSSNPGHRTRR